MLEKFKSRKFLLALAGVVISAIVLFFPGSESEVTEIVTKIVAAVIAVGATFGYIKTEGELDKAAIENPEVKNEE